MEKETILLTNMQTVNLIYKDKSDIPYDIIHFPDGEVHIKLGEINRKECVKVFCRLKNSEDLFILMQIGDILNRQEVEWHLTIFYLMSMRMDRVISFNESYSLKVVANIINSLHPKTVSISHPHSRKTLELIDNSASFILQPKFEDFRFSTDYQLCYPDDGAYDRYGKTYKAINNVLIGKKKRNTKTGKIESITIQNPIDYILGKTVVVIDDLCDTGGTFVGIAESLRNIYKEIKLQVSVVHMVNRKGIEKLSKTYDKVYFTNTYNDWNDLPDNCEIKNVIN